MDNMDRDDRIEIIGFVGIFAAIVLIAAMGFVSIWTNHRIEMLEAETHRLSVGHTHERGLFEAETDRTRVGNEHERGMLDVQSRHDLRTAQIGLIREVDPESLPLLLLGMRPE